MAKKDNRTQKAKKIGDLGTAKFLLKKRKTRFYEFEPLNPLNGGARSRRRQRW